MHPIVEAIENDDFETFKKLASEPENLNAIDPDGWNILALTTQYEMPEYVEFLLDNMSEQQIKEQKPSHPFQIAAKNKNSELGKMILLHPKTDKNQLFQNNENFFFTTILEDNDELTTLLLEQGVSPFTNNNQGDNAVSLLVEKGKNDFIKQIRKMPEFKNRFDDAWLKKSIEGNHFNIFKQLHSYSRLSVDEIFNMAIDSGNIEVMAKIVDDGDLLAGPAQITSIVDLMCKNYTQAGQQKAAQELTDYLFEIKTPFNRFVDKHGRSAWMLAISNNNQVVFDRLVAGNESVNEPDNREHTPAYYAIEYNNPKMLAQLLKKKADYNAIDENKESLLIKAVRKNNDHLVDELLKYPVDLNHTNNNNENALSISIHLRRFPIISKLIWAGANLSSNPAQFYENNDIYHINAFGQYEKLINDVNVKEINNFIALSQLGFNLNQVNEDGDTFLLNFIKNGFLANFKTLLRCNMNGNQIDAQGNSALMCAMTKNIDDFSLGMLQKFPKLNLDIINQKGEDVYDLCVKSHKSERMEKLIKYDAQPTVNHLVIAISTIVSEGNLEKNFALLNEKIEASNKNKQNLAEKKINLTAIEDSNGNSLLMLAAAYSNRENFTFLLSQNDVNYKKEIKNKAGYTLDDIIAALPEEDVTFFQEQLNLFKNKRKKHP
jgi:ankyrin repeat protein